MEDGRFHFDVASVLDGVEAPDGGPIPPFIAQGVLRDVAERVLDALVSVWPVDTGRSLQGFRVRESSSSFEVENLTPYTRFVADGLAERTAEAALTASRQFAVDQVRNLLARKKLPAGVRQARGVVPRQERERVARELEAAGAPADATALLARGETQAAVRAYVRGLEVAEAVRVAEALDLPPGVLALVRRGAVRRAVDELLRLGRLGDARALQQGTRLAA